MVLFTENTNGFEHNCQKGQQPAATGKQRLPQAPTSWWRDHLLQE